MFFLSKLKKILIILFSSKIIFKDPNKTDILVLDNLGKDRLMPLIENYNYYILPIRDQFINELNFSLKVLNNLIRNIRKLMGYNVLRKDYYKFKDVNKTLSSRGSKSKKKSKKK